MATLATLKKKAAEFGYTVEDDKQGTAISVHAPKGKAWEGGALTSLVNPYGSCGSYLPEWRKTAIEEMIERLEYYPPSELVDLEEEEDEQEND